MAYIYRMSAMAEWEIKSRIADPIVLSALRELDRRLRERFDGKYLKLLLLAAGREATTFHRATRTSQWFFAGASLTAGP